LSTPNLSGIPIYDYFEFNKKSTKFCLLIPIINERGKIERDLARALYSVVSQICYIIICDGGSNDGSTDTVLLKSLGVNTLLVKKDKGKQSAQLRMGLWWALQRHYEGFITIDGNNKDSIEDASLFIKKLNDGFDFVQGSRFLPGGNAINTPITRLLAVKLIHAPIISITAGHPFTDTTNAFRAYSRKYIEHPDVQPFRDVFETYELLAYLSTRASQLGLKVCEIPVSRIYPPGEKTPTKIKGIRGYSELLKILLLNLLGAYKP